jgi:type I restriction enzyme S subunit
MKWLSVPLKVVAPPKASRQEFEPKQIVWHLTLDQIESQTGKIINKQLSPASDAGSSTFVFDNGNVLYSKLRPYLNKVIHPQESGIATTELIPLRPLENILNENYLTYYLRSNIFLSFVKQYTTGARMPRVIMDKFWEHYIPLPTLSEQRRIVEILDQADALRRMRAEADAKGDRILPALFIKMFGDPSTNPMGWDVNTLGNLLTDIESGWSPKCESREAAAEEWGVLKLSSVTYGNFKPTENKALLPGDSPRPNLEVKRGDLLFTRKNTHDLVGASAFVHKTRPRLMLPDLIFRLCLSNELDPVYLWQLLSQKAMRYQLSALAGGTAGSMPNISKARLRTLSIPVPPLNLQLKYREISNKFWETQQNQKTSTQIINSLFQTLLQRACSGELTAKWREAHRKELLAEMEEQAKALKLRDNADPQQLSLL